MTKSAAASAAPVPASSEAAASEAVARVGVPATVQPRGVLLAVRVSDGVVLHASAATDLLGLEVSEVLGKPLSDVLGAGPAGQILAPVVAGVDLATVNPLVVERPARCGGGELEAILHRPRRTSASAPSLVVVELAPRTSGNGVATGYGPLRTALADLELAESLDELYDVALEAMRTLTGFERVSLYLLDAQGNAEVVAEAHRRGLAPWTGVHFPASDIPAEVRELHQSLRVHLVDDTEAEPVPVLAADPSVAGRQLDLSAATLRAEPREYVALHRARGARATIAVGLSYGGELWGVVYGHHYGSPKRVPYDVRVGVELIASTLSALRAAQVGADRDAEARRQERVLAHLAADSRDESVPLGTAITRSGWTRRLVRADGAIVRAEGRVTSVGHVPDAAGQQALIAWVSGAGEEVIATDCLRETAPDVAAAAPDVAGVMGIALPEGQVLIWLRDEVQRRVEWGSDPSSSRPLRADDPIRTMLRASEERWREVVDGHSLPWTEDQVDSAAALRVHLLEALYLRGRKEVRATEELQRSLLPHDLAHVDGWTVEARYEAAGAGLVGGDWYDALVLPSGHLALVVGDVTGHGLQAAATMGQLRTALRTSLVGSSTAHEAARLLFEVVRWTLPGEVATLTVALVDPVTGVVENVSLGHPPLLVVQPDGAVRWGPKAGAPPLGLARDVPPATRVEVPLGGALVLYSDGLVERRDESIGEGLARLATAFVRGPAVDVDEVLRSTRDERSADDATLLVVRREA
ncbi:SpoIIE family protein phosphatase [Isoptericola variabilis]|uniref:Putative PAS/PAC sensor protein n=1 Tax=Isoptericola variabilis (strain 225) TaxID=743718 RepID=F6FU87_ISOV2|nr:SpoIIE family protein phosphatase [Isoptericola variabilis]AEG43283.1 putative PAS/PAC sensor protein [Isoptericola variabilis 225]